MKSDQYTAFPYAGSDKNNSNKKVAAKFFH